MVREDQAIGFLVNIEQESSFLGTICKKYFVLVLMIGVGVGIKYALLDSLVDEPLYLQTINHVTNFIQAQVQKKGEAMVVVKNKNKNDAKVKKGLSKDELTKQLQEREQKVLTNKDRIKFSQI